MRRLMRSWGTLCNKIRPAWTSKRCSEGCRYLVAQFTIRLKTRLREPLFSSRVTRKRRVGNAATHEVVGQVCDKSRPQVDETSDAVCPAVRHRAACKPSAYSPLVRH